MTDADLDLPLDHAWICRHAPGSICAIGCLPRIPLPNTDRDDGDWCLGVDRKHEFSTILLYANFGKPSQVYRRIAVIQTRRQLIAIYDQICARAGAWAENSSKPKNARAAR